MWGRESDLAASYSTWEQLAGYFDGDGSVTIVLGKYTIQFYLDWADQSLEQLVQIASFLRSQNLKTGIVRKAISSESYYLRIADQKGVVAVAERLQPLLQENRRIDHSLGVPEAGSDFRVGGSKEIQAVCRIGNPREARKSTFRAHALGLHHWIPIIQEECRFVV